MLACSPIKLSPTHIRMKRRSCPQCKRPVTACICRWITPTANDVQVLILQHPLEAINAKGSATLLSLSLSRCRVVIGEQFNNQELEALLYAPWLDSNSSEPCSPVLLYPGEETVGLGSTQPRLRLIVLDATWRKSRKMIYLNPLLSQLPRFSLNAPAASRYSVRKAQRPEQRSTLEATCAALEQVAGATAIHYEPLLTAFDGFVASLAARANKS
jgi:DTW domain-containing protein